MPETSKTTKPKGKTLESLGNKDGSNAVKEPQHGSHDSNSVVSLTRNFRSYASTLSLAARYAEKLTHMEANSGEDTTGAKKKESKTPEEVQKELKDAVRMTLHMRRVMREKTTLLEDKLRGNAKESEALHCMMRSQPCVGGKKRKFTVMNCNEK